MGDDINYGELFGVEVSDDATGTDAGENTEKNTSENEQEIADPAESDTEETETTEDGEADGKAVQSREENARYAAARRKAEAERDAAVAQAKADAQAEAQKTIDEAFRNMGLYDPYTKKPITNKAEYDAYKQKSDIEKKSRVAKASGMSETEFNEFVAELPEVKAAREKQAQAEEAMKQAQAAQAQVKIGEQISEIAKLDPSIKSLDDLKKMENYGEFYERVKSGHNLVDAYKLTNFDKLTQASANGAKQAAINAINGKSHLEKTSGRGTGSATVPKDILEQYRMFNPDATDAEIQKHYNKHIKK